MASKASQSRSSEKNDGKTADKSSGHKINTTRVCIKGIPPMYDEMALKRHILHSATFNGSDGSGLVITDCKVLKTKNGHSRKVAFVGFKTSEMAQYVISYFHRTYAQTSRIIVEAAVEKGGMEKRKKCKDQANSMPSSSSLSSKRVDNSSNSSRDLDRKKEEFLSVMMGGKGHNGSNAGRSINNKFWANDGGEMLTNDSRVSNDFNEESKDMDMKETTTDSKNNVSHRSNLLTNQDGGESEKSVLEDKKKETKKSIVEKSKDEEQRNSSEISDMDFLRSKIVDMRDFKHDSGMNDVGESDSDSIGTNSSSVTSSESDSSSTSSDSGEGDGNDQDDRNNHNSAPQKPSTSSTSKNSMEATKETPKQEKNLRGPLNVTTKRLFLRNVPFCATVDELIETCSSCCGFEVVDCHIPIDDSKRNKGYAFIKFSSVEDASIALEKLDGIAFQGRLLHVLPAKEEINNHTGNAFDENDTIDTVKSTRKKTMELSRQQEAGNSTTGWSTNYIRGDAVVDNLANRLGLKKGDIFNVKDDLSSGNAAVRLALGETHVIEENRSFFRKHGIDMDVLMPSSDQSGNDSSKRSQTTILVKNLPYNTSHDEIIKVFHSIGGDVPTILLPPSRTIALVEYSHANDAKRAFRKLAYKRFKHVPLYLEWAPLLAETERNESAMPKETSLKRMKGEQEISHTTSASPKSNLDEKKTSILDEDSEGRENSSTIFVKNLNFKTTEDNLCRIFEETIGNVKSVKIPTKVTPIQKIRGVEGGKVKHLSMGYGFVEMKSEEIARSALKKLQGKFIDGHAIELKLSTKDGNTLNGANPNSIVTNRQNTKVMVRNVPFQTSRTELLKLFGSFGQLRTVRLPKKFDGGHRGFAFVEFVTGNEASNAMKALSQTHLYGRHLVLEWADDKNDIETLRGKAKRDANAGSIGVESNNRKKTRLTPTSNSFT